MGPCRNADPRSDSSRYLRGFAPPVPRRGQRAGLYGRPGRGAQSPRRFLQNRKREGGREKGYEYWREQDELNHSPYTLRMVNLAGGPRQGILIHGWPLVGCLTCQRHHHHGLCQGGIKPPHRSRLNRPELAADRKSHTPEIDRINRGLSDRQRRTKLAEHFLFQQRSQTPRRCDPVAARALPEAVSVPLK